MGHSDPLSTELNRKIVDAADLVKECDALEELLVKLRASYEQFFLGVERHPPSGEHDALKRRMTRLRAGFVRQTAIKFRISNLASRLLTYERLWSRTLAEMENGTYRRDIFKARLHAQRRRAAQGNGASSGAAATPPVGPLPSIAPLSRAAQAPTAGSVPPAVSPTARAPGGLSDQRVAALFDEYVAAKQRCNEDTSKLSAAALGARLREQLPRLLREHNVTSVDFKVVIKDGRAVLRAVPK